MNGGAEKPEKELSGQASRVTARRFLFALWQTTWGSLQTAAGFFLFLLFIRRPHELFHGAVVTRWGYASGVSLGLFTFVPGSIRDRRSGNVRTLPENYVRKVVVHEYGHCVQSLVLGPLYLFLIGAPSLIWNTMFEKYRNRRAVSYYEFYTESLANSLGERTTGGMSLRPQKPAGAGSAGGGPPVPKEHDGAVQKR